MTRRQKLQAWINGEQWPTNPAESQQHAEDLAAELKAAWDVIDAMDKHARDCWIGMKRFVMGSPEMVPFDDTPEPIRKSLNAYHAGQSNEQRDCSECGMWGGHCLAAEPHGYEFCPRTLGQMWKRTEKSAP